MAPSADALDRLRRAVPRRRARRRQAIGGAIALVVLTGAAIPLIRLTGGDAVRVDQAARPAPGASSGSSSAGAYPGLGTPGGGAGGSGSGSGSPSGGGQDGSSPGYPVATLLPGGGSGMLQPVPGSSGTGGSASGGSTAGGRGGTLPPECSRSQLGRGAASVGQAASDGVVYGSFDVTNVSGRACTVSGAGTVTVGSVHGTSAGRIQVVAHTASDPASQLPPPQEAPANLVLQPEASYRVEFGWVPNSGNGTDCTNTAPAATAGSGTPGANSLRQAVYIQQADQPEVSGGETGPTTSTLMLLATGAALAQPGYAEATFAPALAAGTVADASGTVADASALSPSSASPGTPTAGASDRPSGSSASPSGAAAGGSTSTSASASASPSASASMSSSSGPTASSTATVGPVGPSATFSPAPSPSPTASGRRSVAPSSFSGSGSPSSGGSQATTNGQRDGGDPSPTASASPTPSKNVTVTLDHTPGPGGAPVASAQLRGACSGTVYRTEPLPASSTSASSGSTTGAGSSTGTGSTASEGPSGTATGN